MMFATKWLTQSEMDAIAEQQRKFAENVIVDIYTPDLPICVAKSLLNCALENWGTGPASATFHLTDPLLREMILNAYNSPNRGKGVLIIRDEKGEGWRYAYVCSQRSQSKALIAGALWIEWPSFEGEMLQ